MDKEKNFDEIPEVDLSKFLVDSSVIKLVPPVLAEKYKLIPLYKVGKTLTVSMADPKNVVAIDDLRAVTKMDISVSKSPIDQIREAISENYGISGVVETVINSYKQPMGETKLKNVVKEDAPIVKLVDIIIVQAISKKASDIHIEPQTDSLRIRFRIDGILHEEISMPLFMLLPIVSRIKVLCGMDIAETRIPQDGRYEYEIDNRKIDLRISTFPSSHGEKVVLRILDKSSMIYRLKEIGMSNDNFLKFEKIIHKPHGIVLVTGPTGSGKTTTLYATLFELDRAELNIVTVEDPIEYEVEGITQSQVNVKAGHTFATALRSILRQDPDVVLVGEIRDAETSTVSVQAALTGHLVFSTLHTNDAVGAIIRLIDMKVEPFLVSSSLEAVLAQRLVRKICPKCKEEYPAPESVVLKHPELKILHRGKGCKSCNSTGYKGRTGLFELLVVDDGIRKMIGEKQPADIIKKYAVENGMKTLYEDGISKVLDGTTTLDEVLRVTEIGEL